LNKFLLNKFHKIYPVSEEMGNRIKKYLNDKSKIQVLSDTRFDQIKYRQNNKNTNISLPENFKKTKNILFGSIENKELPIIIDALSKFKKNFKTNNVNLIFVPHEPEENILINLESQLKELDIIPTRYNNMINTNYKNDYNALLIDRTGILADLYKYSSISYIGCGFSKGVHNVAEPAIYGNTICFGPRYHILNEAIEMIQENIAYCIESSEQLLAVLSIILNDKKLDDNRKKVENYIKTKFDSTDYMINEIF